MERETFVINRAVIKNPDRHEAAAIIRNADRHPNIAITVQTLDINSKELISHHSYRPALDVAYGYDDNTTALYKDVTSKPDAGHVLEMIVKDEPLKLPALSPGEIQE